MPKSVFRPKNMINKGLMIVALLAATSINAQDVAPYAPGNAREGIVYYLPKTQIQVKVIANKVTYTPGELCQYGERYLKLQGISSQPKEYWEIQNILVKAIGVPDTSKAYTIKLKDKMVTSQVELTEDGIIKAINTSSPHKPAADPLIQTQDNKRTDPRHFMTEEMLMAGSTGKMAELIAKEIYNIRESKNILTRGQADYMPQDGTALKIMLDNLEEQEKAFTEMFSGYTHKETKTFSFNIEPQSDINNQVVFRFSKKLGILAKDNLAGEPIYISISDQHTSPTNTEEPKKKPAGIIYNIPGKAAVTVKSNNKKYFEGNMLVTQFGESEVLTNSLFNQKVNTRVIFNPITGGISKIDKD